MRTDTSCNWFSVPIEVKGVASRAELVIVSHHIDFGAILKRLGERGTVDEWTLRLYRVEPDGREMEEPVQFSPDPQPGHPGRHLHPGTSENVSWAGSWPVYETPSALRVAGMLTWIAKGRPNGVCQYKLLFGIPRDGVFVQVPFPPNNLRHFDAEGHPTLLQYFPRMQIGPQWPLEGKVHILRDGALLTSYQTGPTDGTVSAARRPYFYPVNGPDGISLTELGKPHDPTGSHAHHYSLWIAHANVGGSDFWSERGGLIYHEQFELMEDGPIFARLIQRTLWELRDEGTRRQGYGEIEKRRDASQSLLLRGRRQLTFYAAAEGFRLMDVELELSPGDSAPIELGKTPFGFLAARVAQSMTVFDGSGEIVNALGQRNEQGAHWQRAPWIDQSGPIASERWGGIALFDHPDNPGHPTAWHCRNDGWAGASFNLDQARTIEPNSPLRLRYRVHLHRHDATAGEVVRRYEEYTCKPTVQLGTPLSL